MRSNCSKLHDALVTIVARAQAGELSPSEQDDCVQALAAETDLLELH
jgi:hypothetical protein